MKLNGIYINWLIPTRVTKHHVRKWKKETQALHDTKK